MSSNITKHYEDGKLNDYMYNKLLKALEKGSNNKLEEELIQDGKNASDFGVLNDKDYNTYFFICNLIDDILEDTFGTRLDENKKKDLIRHVFSYKNNEKYNLSNLVDLRLAIYEWFCKNISKKAYPNTAGKNDRNPVYNVDKWIEVLKNIYACVHNKKMDKDDAIKYFTQAWDSDERYSFINWLRYYEAGNTEKYNVKNAKLTKQAEDIDFAIPQSWARQSTTPYMSTQKIEQKTNKEKEIEQAKYIKMKMRSRLLAFKKLLDKYNDVLPKQNLENIYNEIHKLDVSISRLDVYASMQDCIIRSANIIRKCGFSEGAEFLEKVAETPATEQEIMQSVPKGISDQTNLPQGAKSLSIKTIIDRLEGVSKALKSRDMIRELASIDILLNELGLASYFPDLSFAQAKLIESFGYSSNKVEDIIAKLRGSGVSRPKAPEIKAPEIKPPVATTPSKPVVPPSKPMDTGEIMSKPIGEVKKELPTKTE